MAVSGYIIIKLASRCNLNCGYCYWFRDDSVYEKPAIIQDDVVDAFIIKLERHIIKYKIPEFNCIFHGGEPLMYNMKKFEILLKSIHEIEERTGCLMLYSIATNGVLINKKWCDLFNRYNINISVSIDGTQEVHDKNRPTLTGRGSYQDVIKGYKILKENGINPAILAVCDPDSNPKVTLDHFILDLECEFIEVLIPDFTFDDSPISVGDYYIELFNHWYDNYLDKGIEVRFLVGLIRGVLGLQPNSDSFGFAPMHTICLLTDGALEPLDVLRIAGYESTKTEYNILKDEISEIKEDKLWDYVYKSSTSLCKQCQECDYKYACGGGHLSQRWSKLNGYDNPSVYCSDFKKIFSHVSERISKDINIQSNEYKQIDIGI